MLGMFKILRGHQSRAMVGGLWQPATPRPPPAGDGRVHDPAGASDSQKVCSDQPRERTCVDMDTFWARLLKNTGAVTEQGQYLNLRNLGILRITLYRCP